MGRTREGKRINYIAVFFVTIGMRDAETSIPRAGPMTKNNRSTATEKRAVNVPQWWDRECTSENFATVACGVRNERKWADEGRS